MSPLTRSFSSDDDYETFSQFSVWCMEKALVCRPDFGEAAVNLSTMYMKNDRAQEAVVCIYNAIALQCSNKELRHNHAVSLRLIGRRDLSISLMRSILGFSKNTVQPVEVISTG